jgi:predicted permease
VLPERYGVDAEYAGTLVVLSTVLGIFTIPLAFWGASVF